MILPIALAQNPPFHFSTLPPFFSFLPKFFCKKMYNPFHVVARQYGGIAVFAEDYGPFGVPTQGEDGGSVLLSMWFLAH